MINFCHQCLRPTITCDKVSADDYDVENLISDRLFIKQRGFRAECFIVAPVSITVHFPCKVDVSRIVLDPIVGRQRSSGFEIFTATHTANQPSNFLYENKSGGQGKIDEFRTNRSNFEPVFVLVGKLILKDPGTVCFENMSYKPRRPFTEFSLADNNTVYQASLRHRRITSLSAVNAVTIRIVCTVERSAPALRRLEIWGQPAVSCPREIQQKVFDLYKSTFHVPLSVNSIPAIFQSDDIQTEGTQTKVPVVSMSDTEPLRRKPSMQDADLDIPEDFTDLITCEIMALPLTLPSGKTIDQSTLDKHINAESAWGRPPSDPFTGVAFDNARKPVPNVSLKLRIDQFLLNHSATLKTTPRTVGRASDLHNCHINHMLVNSSIPSAVPSSKILIPKHCTSSTIPAHCKNLTTTTVSTVYKTNILEKAEGNCATTSGILKRKGPPVEVTSSNAIVKSAKLETQDSLATKPRSHETQLSQSLDAAVFAALGGLPSYQTVNCNTTTSSCVHSDVSSRDVNNWFSRSLAPRPMCANCSNEHDVVGHSLYCLPCGDHMCKNCLISLPKHPDHVQARDIHVGLSKNTSNSSSSCPACGHQFHAKDVVKLNL